MRMQKQILVFTLLGMFLIMSFLQPVQADNNSITILNPHVQPSTIRVGDSFGINATSSGMTNATVTFSYTIENQTGSNSTFNGQTANVSKSFLSPISNQSAQTAPVIPSPLVQFKSGIPAQNVKCEQGLQLVIKAEDNSQLVCHLILLLS
jgi:hypothetical protein